MNTRSEKYLKTGGDPRTLPDFVALRDELNKLHHPARPDVNWEQAERLCLSLFSQNGVELQTAAWYTLIRTTRAGLAGLNEGLAIIHGLVTHQWQSIWPQQVHARVDVLAGLSQRLINVLRTQTFVYADLSSLYQTEKYLNQLCQTLQQLELKHVSQLERLSTFIHNAAMRLESLESLEGANMDVALKEPLQSTVEFAQQPVPSPKTPQQTWVYVVKPEEGPKPNVVVMSPEPPEPPGFQWKAFFGGILLALVLCAGGVGGWYYTIQDQNKVDPRLQATIPPLPAILPNDVLYSLTALSDKAREENSIVLETTQARLKTLNTLSPTWGQDYGFALVHQAKTIWPHAPLTAALAEQWQKQLTMNATPIDSLGYWQDSQDQLADLTRRLNELDIKRGRYMTGSELKSAVFTLTQTLNKAPPLEEKLRQLEEASAKGELPPALIQQTDLHFIQLLNRYSLIKQNRNTSDRVK
ncbi:VasL domain-containing protein [Xenorhabdus szentirmaii]|uniref:VasL domain-containing protein n=1 Tax=Xenorhabdus szentirmaii TaxID=290112 RepID=UPI00199EF92E|nr:VasL domain-containing protein [Xenorhabdus sp. 5]MBD2826422.1 type VI secretion system ImpA family N-terminal domain-containing protein [Xenorhabdus sp. 5]